MAIGRISICGLSLCIVVLLWPSPSLAGDDPCTEEMKQIYSSIRASYKLRLEESKNGPGNYDRELVEKYVPAFKKKCGTKEADSVRDLENSKYFTRLVAEHMREKKAHADIRYQPSGAGQDEDLEDLVIIP
ncbi:MAG: hypothetical protein GDA67_13650 [Nitrospira sp. CR1.3]|nr:hypothetical protein [Nitrospira sp. CR1.3]